MNFLQGKRIGYRHTVVREFESDEHRYAQTDINEQQSLLRFGEKISLSFQVTQLVDDAGGIKQFAFRLPIGSEISATYGRVRDGILTLGNGTVLGVNTERAMPLSAQVYGFSGLEESLAALPMQPGEQRTIQMLQLPPLPLVGAVELNAQAEESTKLPAGEVKLLRIDETLKLPGGGSILCHLWTDAKGEILKYSVPAMRQETFLATREQALDTSEDYAVDLGSDMLVRLAKPLDDPHQQKLAVYRVRRTHDLFDVNSKNLLPRGASQDIKVIDDQIVEVTVRAIRPDSPETPPFKETSPTDADLRASALVESDSPAIARLAMEATGSKVKSSPPGKTGAAIVTPQTETWRQAVEIEKFVHGYLTQKNYSQAFSSATEVARSREGDCTEHSVLVAALCRAQGIPTRVAYGLVYVAGEQAFAFHMWNEVWIGDRWVPLDATLAQGGIGVGHLKFGHSSLSDISALLQLLPVMQAVGKLEIVAVDATTP